MSQPAVAAPTTPTPATPVQPAAGRSPVPPLIVACLGILIANLPIAGVTVILGAIGADTHADTPDLQWVTSSYVLAMAAAVLSAGVIADVYGRKHMLVTGFALAAIGAGIGVLAGLFNGMASVYTMWVSQALMGIGGGALLTSTLTLISHLATNPHQRTKYVGMWASFLLLGAGIGPFISGIVLSFTSWGWVFVPLAILALLMIPVTLAFVRETAPIPGRSLDIAGQATAIIAVAALVYGIIEGGASGWGSTSNIAGIIIGLVLLVAFVIVEKRATSPLVRLDVFRSAGFTVSAIAAMVALFSVVGSAFVLSLFFSTVQHLTVLETAERVVFLLGTAAVFGPVAARLQKTMNPRVPLILGLLVGAAGMTTLIGISADSALIDVAWRLALAGAGLGMVLSTVSAVAIHSVPLPLAGMAGATNTLFRQIGGALGPAVIGAIATTRVKNGGTFEEAIHVAGIVIAITLAATALMCAVVLFIPQNKPQTEGQ